MAHAPDAGWVATTSRTRFGFARYTENIRLQLDFKAMADSTYDTIDFTLSINKLTISSAAA